MIAIEAEQALIGACVLNIEIVDMLDGMVAAEDFGEPIHAQIFDVLARARREGRRVDFKLLIALMGDDAAKELEGAGLTVAAYIARLASEATTTLNARDFARVILEYAGYRKLASTSARLSEMSAARHVAGSPAEIAADAIAELDQIVTSNTPSSVRRMSIGEAATQAVASLNDVLVNGTKRGITWGLTDMDRATLGMRSGQLVILAARPSAGKTTVGVSVALAAARAGAGVMFVSLEMVAQELAERALSDMTHAAGRPVPYATIIAGNATDAEMNAVIEAAGTLQKLPVSIEQQGGLSVSQVVSRARVLRAKWERRNQPLSLIVIDHLGLLQASGRYSGNRHSEIGEITGSLKMLAKEMGVPILLLCQLNRAVESRDNKRPQLSDLRESGRIEEDADMVIFLYREAYYLERQKSDDPAEEMERQDRLMEVQNKLEMIIAKQRQGPTKTIDVFVSMAHNAVRNLENRAFNV